MLHLTVTEGFAFFQSISPRGINYLRIPKAALQLFCSQKLPTTKSVRQIPNIFFAVSRTPPLTVLSLGTLVVFSF